jgi:uncharacterized repeat protein (TIGR02543 family)
VSFNVGGSSTVIADQSVTYGQAASVPAITPANWIKDGREYIFSKWFLNGVEYDFDTPVYKDTTLTATYTDEGATKIYYYSMQGGVLTLVQTDKITTGTKAVEPPSPKVTGKVFNFWNTFDGVDPSTASGVPFDFTQNLTEYTYHLIVKWSTATYTVSFNTGGSGSYIQPQTVEHGSKASKPEDPTAWTQGGLEYTFSMWVLNGVEYDFNTPIYKDTTLTATWISEGATKVNFYMKKGGEEPVLVRTDRIVTGTKEMQPADPQADGLTFLYWSQDGSTEPFDFTQNLQGSEYNLYPNWRTNVYTVIFDYNGGTGMIADKSVSVYGPPTQIDNSSVTLEGFDLIGWSSVRNGDITQASLYNVDGSSSITSPLSMKDGAIVTLYAKWSIKTYSVTFEYTSTEQTTYPHVEYGSIVTVPEGYVPYEGCRLVWNCDGVPFDVANTPITADTVLVAQQIVVYTVSFDSDGGSAVPSQTVDKDSKATRPADPTRSGFRFQGWTLDGNSFDFSTKITSDITLKAKWIAVYSVKFDSNGGSAVPSQNVEKGSKAIKPANPTMSSNLFLYWYTTDESVPYDFTSPVDGDVMLKAMWKSNYRVTFDSMGGTAISPVDVDVSGTATVSKPDDPTRTGYDFVHWYVTDPDTPYDFDTYVTSDMVLHAKWISTYKVSFNTDGGSANPDTQTIRVGGTAVQPADPTKEGNRFLGWYNGSLKFDFSTKITSDITLTAKWMQRVTVTFDSDGGTPVDPVTLDKGSKVSEPTNVKKGDLYLKYWHVSGQDTPYDFNTPVNSNMALVAKWVVIHTVAFNSVGGTPVPSQTVEDGYSATKPADPERESSRFDGWYNGTVLFDFSTAITSDITLTAHWVEIRTVTFDSDGGTAVPSQTVDYGSKAKKPDSPTKDDSVFVYWHLAGETEEYDFSTAITSDITLVAKWKTSFIVTFDSEGGSPVNPVEIPVGGTLTKPEDPKWEGHSFKYWYENAGTKAIVPYVFGAAINSDFTLHAMWVEQATVEFDSAGGSPVQSQTVDVGSAVTEPEQPTYGDYIFQYWYETDESVPYVFGTPVEASTTLHAKWKTTWTVTFDSAGGSQVGPVYVTIGDKLSEPSDPIRSGYSFQYWYETDESVPYVFGEVIGSDLTLHAKWVKVWTVSFDTDGGLPVPAMQTIVTGNKAVEPETDPAKAGYKFLGWYLNDTEYDFDTKVTASITLTAHWIQLFTVTFESTGESTVPSQVVESGKKASEPEDPTWEGHKFLGWYLDDTEYDFDAPVTANITLVGHWSDIHTVVFDSDNGSPLEYVHVLDGSKVQRPEDPVKVGYDFLYWHKQGETSEYDFDTPVTSDFTLVAKWSEITKKHTVTFDSAGGSPVPAQTVAHGECAVEPADPVRDGFRFLGWYNGIVPYNFDTPVTKDITLTAEWERVIPPDPGVIIVIETETIINEDGSKTEIVKETITTSQGDVTVNIDETTTYENGDSIVTHSTEHTDHDGTNTSHSTTTSNKTLDGGGKVEETVIKDKAADGSTQYRDELTLRDQDGELISKELTVVNTDDKGKELSFYVVVDSDGAEAYVPDSEMWILYEVEDFVDDLAVRNVTVCFNCDGSIVLPEDYLKETSDMRYSVTLYNDEQRVLIDSEIIKEMSSEEVDGVLTMKRAYHPDMTDSQWDVIGENYAIILTINMGGHILTELAGPVEVQIFSQTHFTHVYHVKENGDIEEVACHYDESAEVLEFTLYHFSMYAITVDPIYPHEEGSDYTVFIVIAAVAILALAALILVFVKRH